MSDKVELIAAAQVAVATGTISFNSNYGFKAASYTGVGIYNLELDHEHGTSKLVIGVTQMGTSPGEVSASVLDKRHIQVNNSFDSEAADGSFFITVFRVRD